MFYVLIKQQRSVHSTQYSTLHLLCILLLFRFESFTDTKIENREHKILIC